MSGKLLYLVRHLLLKLPSLLLRVKLDLAWALRERWTILVPLSQVAGPRWSSLELACRLCLYASTGFLRWPTLLHRPHYRSRGDQTLSPRVSLLFRLSPFVSFPTTPIFISCAPGCVSPTLCTQHRSTGHRRSLASRPHSAGRSPYHPQMKSMRRRLLLIFRGGTHPGLWVRSSVFRTQLFALQFWHRPQSPSCPLWRASGNHLCPSQSCALSQDHCAR